jgi:hypothetical protein
VLFADNTVPCSRRIQAGPVDSLAIGLSASQIN